MSRRKLVAHGYEDRRLRILAEEAIGPEVLDLGYAQSPNRYLAARRDLRVTGFDLAASTDSGYAETLQGDVTKLPGALSGRLFDTIIAGELIEHLEEPYAFLRRLRALLAPRGRLALSTPNPLSFPMVFSELVGDRRHFYFHGHTYSFAPRWMERMFALAGFDVIKKRSVGLWVPGVVIPWCPIGLSYQVIYVAEPRAADDADRPLAAPASGGQAHA